jgi:O-antigen ligase
MKWGIERAERSFVFASVLLWGLFCAISYFAVIPSSPNFLPLVPLALGLLTLAVRKFEQFLMLLAAMIPISVVFRDLGGGVGAALPGEFFLLVAFAGISLLLLSGRWKFQKAFVFHPLSLLIGLQMLWAAISTLESSHTTVSFKFLLSRIIYILVFYFAIGHLSLESSKAYQFLRNYILGFLPIIVYSIVILASMGLSRKYSPIMSQPFYDDHTLFGVCLTWVLPMSWWLWKEKKLFPEQLAWLKKWHWLGLALVLAGIWLSFSRAAWISLPLMGGFLILLRLRVRFHWILGILLLASTIGFVQRDAIVEKMMQNENVSGEDVLSTAASVTNLSSDDSNLERLNRWSCAIRMWEERPFLGFGPGTYERMYGPFQMLSERTRISTNNGDRGDAHSEYLGALSEQGLPGMLLIGAVFLASMALAMKIIYQTSDTRVKGMTTAILLGLLSFFFHGIVNDFLDIDKAATLFWSMLGMLVAFDLGLKSKPGATLPHSN